MKLIKAEIQDNIIAKVEGYTIRKVSEDECEIEHPNISHEHWTVPTELLIRLAENAENGKIHFAYEPPIVEGKFITTSNKTKNRPY